MLYVCAGLMDCLFINITAVSFCTSAHNGVNHIRYIGNCVNCLQSCNELNIVIAQSRTNQETFHEKDQHWPLSHYWYRGLSVCVVRKILKLMCVISIIIIIKPAHSMSLLSLTVLLVTIFFFVGLCPKTKRKQILHSKTALHSKVSQIKFYTS